MILLDTHIWIWWVTGSSDLSAEFATQLNSAPNGSLLVSAISVWEVAKLVERGRLELTIDVAEWISLALSLPAIRLIPLSPEIAVESTRLPPPFHRDPADQILVATARHLDIPLMTRDLAIRDYPFVRLAN
jgi:PIN domain nuclease of toxin-antitoxin system